MDAIAAQVIASVLSSNLVRETVTGAGKLILESGKKLSKKVTDYMEKAEKGEIPNDEVPEDVQAEIKGSLKDILKETSEPVDMVGAVLYFEQEFTEEEKEDLIRILETNDLNQNSKYQEVVDDFLFFYYGTNERRRGDHFEIEDDVIYLDFELLNPEKFSKMYNPAEVCEFSYALNYLLDELGHNIYITRYSVY